MDTLDLYTRASAGFAEQVHAIGRRWADPTPLPGWDVRELVHHLVHEERWTPPRFGGATIEEVGGRFDGDLLGDDPVAAFDLAADRALAAVRAEGALEATVHLSFGDHAGREYAWQLAADHLVHTWDLARALGADETLDAEVAEAVLAWFPRWETLYRDIDVIGPRVEIAPGVGPQAELLAMFGRP